MRKHTIGFGLVTSFLLAAFAALSAEVSAAAVEMDDLESRLLIMTDAQLAYERGMALELVDPEGARAAFTESADGWNRLIRSGASNGLLWTNLGNAEFRSGRLGDAVAAYLEADRLMPGDTTIRANLTEARNMVPARFDQEGVTVLYDSVSDGWHALGFELRWWIAGLSWIGFWFVLSLRVMRRSPQEEEGSRLAWRGGLTALATVTIVSGTTIGLDVSEDTWRSPGVLTTESVVRSGNGDTFKAVFSEALPAGVEFDLIESRPGWNHVAFADGRDGWLRSDHVHVVGE